MLNLRSVLDKSLDTILSRKSGLKWAFKTGWDNLDTALGCGIPFDTTVTIGARLRVGKSAFATRLLLNIFEYNTDVNKIALYWNWEMPAYQQGVRIFSGFTHKSVTTLMSARESLDELTYQQCIDFRDNLKEEYIYFIDKSVSIDQIEEVIRRVRYDNPNFKILNIFDHTRLIVTKDERTEEEKLHKFYKACINWTKHLNCTNIVLSQLGRKLEEDNRNSKYRNPMDSDLFGADAVAQCSNIIMLLHRPELYDISVHNGILTEGKIFMDIVKNRDGPITKLIFEHDLSKNIIQSL